MRFILLLLTVLFFSHAHASSQCLLDLFQAAEALEAAVQNIYTAVEHCKNNATVCTTLIADVVSDLAKTSGFLANSARFVSFCLFWGADLRAGGRDCAGNNNTACTADISFVVADVADATAVVSKAVAQCKSPSVECIADVLMTAKDLADTAIELDAAIKQCGGGDERPEY